MSKRSSPQANRAKFLIALRSRDWDLLKAILTEDLVWTLPGSSLISGEAAGRQRRHPAGQHHRRPWREL